MLLLALTLAAALLAVPVDAAPPVATPATVIYRCTSANGAVALQDEPCATGQREERREIAAFAAPVLVEDDGSTPADAAPTPAVADIGPAIAPPPSRPLAMPPPLWRCTDLNGHSRFADEFDPQPRCVPLSVLGVDLARAPPSAAGLCRMVEDQCIELGGDAACAAWQERLDAAESALRLAFSDSMAQRRAERDRAKAVIEADCRP